MPMFFFNRLLNAGGQLNLALNVVDGSGNVACDILEIAVDGMYLDQGKPPRLGRSFLVPSARTDWLIVCNNPGEYYVSLTTSVIFDCFSLSVFHKSFQNFRVFRKFDTNSTFSRCVLLFIRLPTVQTMSLFQIIFSMCSN